jgi:hypothetical protein
MMQRMRLIFVLLTVAAAALLAARIPGETPAGLLETHTLFTIYGRGFGMAPILGRLGTYKDFASMQSGTSDLAHEVGSMNGGKPVTTGVELIYAMGVPCKGHGDCLDYLDGSVNVVESYIKPAEERGMAVVLDTQLGRSDPLAQVRRMVDKGYLDHDNVHVAIDPEFHVNPGDTLPGTPIGTVTAAQINRVQAILDNLVSREHLKTKKILIVHQFGDAAVHDGVPYMIRDKATLERFPNVELVIDADGLGAPLVKVRKYNLITSSRIYPCLQFRGIKIFYRSPLERRGHYDKPPMTMRQVFGLDDVPGGIRMEPKPNVVIIA